MAIANPLMLQSDVGDSILYASSAQLQLGFRKAKVFSDGFPPSIWVLYNIYKWDHHETTSRDGIVVVAADGLVESSDRDILSAQGFNINNPGVILFEHSAFRGFGLSFQAESKNLSQSFPQGEISGVTSVIVTGGYWSFYDGYNFEGINIALNGQTEFGPGKYDFKDSQSNDKARSMRYVRAS